jgi:hypothetical protein
MKKTLIAAVMSACMLAPGTVLAWGIPTGGCELLEFLGFKFVKECESEY